MVGAVLNIDETIFDNVSTAKWPWLGTRNFVNSVGDVMKRYIYASNWLDN